jgi:L-ascorbate metabolism protein UlaG (beta-lactamase superfamily)
MLKALGKKPSGERQQRIEQSPNYKDGAFQNLSHTPVMTEDGGFFKIMREYRKRPKTVVPSQPIPVVKEDMLHLHADAPQIVWFGHSSYLISLRGYNILVDPVLIGNASPLSYFGKPFAGTQVFKIEELPQIDLLLLTHDHYDHMSYETLIALKPKVKKIITALGAGSHLEYWGYAPEIITELDWWESTEAATGVKFTAAPGRHFSGRGFKRGNTLWASFILQLQEFKLYLGADSGYDTHFKAIGDKFGPFDIALLESGQYGKYWPHIHMMPEETVQAAIDLKAKILMPVHWGKFMLAQHPWNEPINRVVTAAKLNNVPVVTPRIGKIYTLNSEMPADEWWHFE